MADKNTLRFHADGSFRIMVVGDIHEKNRVDAGSEDYERLIRRALDELKPDLAILMGDIISGGYHEDDGTRRNATPQELQQSVRRVVAPFRELGVPLASVFGNHDGESGEPKELLLRLFQEEYDRYLVTDTPGITGCGNCNLTIRASASERDAFNLWLMDSGNRAPKGMGKYAYVKNDQIRWYEEKSAALREANGGKPLPAMLFQHIPVWEEYLLLKKTCVLNPYHTRGSCSWEKSCFVPNEKILRGYVGEGPCTPDINNGQFDSWKAQGDILAALFGHDHMNDFIGLHEGIYLLQNKCAGFHIYGDGLKQGVRSVILNEQNPRTFQTRMVRYREFFGTDRKSIPFLELFPDRWHRNFYASLTIAGGVAAVGAAVAAAKAIKKKRGG